MVYSVKVRLIVVLLLKLVVVLVGFSFLLSFLSPVKGSTVVGFFFFLKGVP